MKKGIYLLFITLLILVLLPFTVSADSTESAGSYMWIYNQDYNGMWARTSLNTTDKPRTLSSSGCGIYTMAHATQWLTGVKRDETNGLELLQKLIQVSNRPWEGSLNKYYDGYMKSLGIKKGTKPSTQSGYIDVFDKGGVIVGNPPGHYDLAIGYTWHDVDNNGTADLLIHMVDSRMDATIWRWDDSKNAYVFRNYHAYHFSTFSQITNASGAKNWHKGGQYWMLYNDFKNFATSLVYYPKDGYYPPTAQSQVTPQSIELNEYVASLDLSQTLQLYVSAYPAGSNSSVTWETSDASVATVSNGIVTPHKVGQVTITARSVKDTSITSSCLVTTFYQGSGTLEFKGVKYPHLYAIGKSFTYSGSVESDVDLSYISITLYTTTTSYTQNISIPAGTKVYQMKNAGDSLFKNLSAGRYWYTITASDVVGRVIGFSNDSSASSSASEHTIWETNRAYSRPVLVGSTEYNGSRYEVYQLPGGDWNVSESFAREKGGHLATFSDADEFAAVGSYCNSLSIRYLNIGAIYSRSNNSWSWVDESPFTYHPWNPNAAEDTSYQYTPYGSMVYTASNIWYYGKATQYEMGHFIVEYDMRKVQQIVLSGETSPTEGDGFVISANIIPSDAANKVLTFTSSNPSIAIVHASTGVVTALEEGDVTITATATDGSNVTGHLNMHVQHRPIHATGVTLSVEDASLHIDSKVVSVYLGSVFNLMSSVAPSNTDYPEVNYSSSDDSVAEVGEYSNTVKATGVGACTITVTTLDGGFIDTLTVIVKPPMSYEEYIQTANEATVCVDTYVQAAQSWFDNKINVYAQSPDGAYFIYNMSCTEEDAGLLTAGTPIRVIGRKAEWAGELEIADATFTILGNDPYVAEPEDVTSKLGTDELITSQNKRVTFKGMRVEQYGDTGAAFAYQNAQDRTGDLYFMASKNGWTYIFCVEFYLCGPDTEVYQAVEALNVGDIIDLEGFLYWYNGIYPHITSVTVNPSSGTCGELLTWAYEDGTLTISGIGDMDDYTWGNTPWNQYLSSITAVVVNDGVTSIGNTAFGNMPNLTSVSLPEGIISIGDSAVSLCSALQTIQLPDSLTTIGETAFSVSGLTDITIPVNVSDIGFAAFFSVPASEIKVAEGNSYYTAVDGVLFSNDMKRLIVCPTGKTGVYSVPYGVQEIIMEAFYACNGITEIILPNSVEVIRSLSFYECHNLTGILIPDSATTIEESLLGYYNDGTFEYGPNKILCHAGSFAASYASDREIPYEIITRSPITEADLVIPAGVIQIDAEAFSGIKARTVKLSENVTVIGSKAFANCSELESIYIPYGCETIAADAFENIEGLTIYGVANSWANYYANRNGFAFEPVTP